MKRKYGGLVLRSSCVAFGMNTMLRPVALSVLGMQGLLISAQEIEFDQGNWRSQGAEYQRRLITVLQNEERVDTMYTEDLSTGELEMVVERHPLARYEYFTVNDPIPALRRRIDIRQQEISDTTYVERIEGGEMVMVVQRIIKDIPNGTYQEFYPNGMIRITGALDGYKPDGTLKKTGTWMEWDAAGNVIREEHYP